MLELLSGLFTHVHAWLFETLVQPTLYNLGLLGYAERAFNALEFALYGVIEIGLMLLILRPLEALWPVERWPDRRAVRVDVLYTALHSLGLVPLAVFLLLNPLVDGVDGTLRLHGYIPPSLEELVPWLAMNPLAAFVVYLAILDFAEYWRHRLQHRFNWWWALHAVHHSQRQLSLWADRRNHLLDDVLADLWMVMVALLIGIPPTHFLGVLVVTRLIQSLSHTNVRTGFGRLGDQLLVSPRYHRMHHGIGVGHEGSALGCNFASLFPLWDMLFGTANFSNNYPATGIRDQIEGADYGEGFVRQQVLGITRLLRALRS
jgi:sterol desaturase/sphingolipid hydroxylase (fatty acid hydroxylase superfamily)